MSAQDHGTCGMAMEDRALIAYKEAKVSIIGNIALFAVKFLFGFLIASISLIADAFHSLSDVGTSFVVYAGFKSASKAPDEEHPFGHGRMENIATIIIGTLLISVGIEFIYEAGSGFFETPAIIVNEYLWLVIVVVVVAIVGKELMARYSNRLGCEIESDTLKADAWHHRADAISSIAVLIALVGAYYGYPILDPIFGLIVSLFIIYTGIGIVRGSIDVLMGRAPSVETIERVKRCALEVDGVAGVHRVVVHDYGQNRVVSMHVEVDSMVHLEEAHRIADEVERCIHRQTRMSATVHVDPTQCVAEECTVTGAIEQILASEEGIISYHKLNVSKRGQEHSVYVHITVDRNMTMEGSHELEHRIMERIERSCPGCEVFLHLEPQDPPQG